jgi:hypothetical protein
LFGTLIALFAFFGIMQSIAEARTISELLTGAGFLLFFVGCVFGWFKDLPAALSILGGFLVILVTALAFPGKLMRVYLFAIPAIPGFLYLYVYLVSKKEKRGHEKQE